MKLFVLIVILFASVSAQAAEVRSHTAGSFAQELNGNTKGVVNSVEGDVEQATQVIMQEAAQDSQKDLRDTLGDINRTNQQKAAIRESIGKQKPNGLGARKSYVAGCPKPPCESSVSVEALRAEKDALDKEIAETSMKLKKAQDRRKKVMDALSSTQKKISDTSSGITGNIK